MNRIQPGKPDALAGIVAIAALIFAGTDAAVAQSTTEGIDRYWDHARLYTGADDALVQSVALSGRLQIDAASVDSGDAEFSDIDLRRFRFGFKAGFAGNLTVHAEGDYDPSGGHLNYLRLTDANVAWNPSDAFGLIVGKQGASFTMDGQTSSKSLLTIDRSYLANNIWFAAEYFTGVTAGGEKSGFVYELGLFSSGSVDRGFGDSDGGEFLLATVGYDFAAGLGADRALLRVNYVDNEPDPNNSGTPPLEQVLSVNFALEAGRFGLHADVAAAHGYFTQSDLSGLMLMPFFNLSDQLQLVTRYTWLDSDDVNGVRFGRYERALETGRGDAYSEIYFGVNYFANGHKLKIQSGLHYSDMDDAAMDGGAYTGWGLTTGLRLSW